MDYEPPQNNGDTERDVEIRPMHVSNSNRRTRLFSSRLLFSKQPGHAVQWSSSESTPGDRQLFVRSPFKSTANERYRTRRSSSVRVHFSCSRLRTAIHLLEYGWFDWFYGSTSLGISSIRCQLLTNVRRRSSIAVLLVFRQRPIANESVAEVTIHITVWRLFVMKETSSLLLRCNRIGCYSSTSIISKSTTQWWFVLHEFNTVKSNWA